MRKSQFLAVVGTFSSFVAIGCDGNSSKNNSADGSVVGDASHANADGSATPDSSTPVVDGSVALDGGAPIDGSATPDGTVADLGPDAPPPTALSAFVGYWKIKSMMKDGRTFSDDGDPIRFRGDVFITENTPEHGIFDARTAITENGRLTNPPNGTVRALTIEDGLFLVGEASDEDPVAAFTTSLDGNILTLTYDASHSEPDYEAPDEIIFERLDAPATTSVGTWRMTSMTLNSNELVADTCVSFGDNKGVVSVLFTIPERFEGSEEVSTSIYPSVDTTCSGKPSNVDNMRLELSLWPDATTGYEGYIYGRDGDAISEGANFFVSGTFETSDGNLTMNVTSCLPSGCETQLPSVIHMTPAPPP